MKMISSEDKEEWLKETYKYLQKLKEDKYGDIRLDYIMLYELHEEEHKEIERLKKEKSILEKSLKLIWKKDIKINYEELDKANKIIEKEIEKEGK